MPKTFIFERELNSHPSCFYIMASSNCHYTKRISYDWDSALVKGSYLTFYGLDIKILFQSSFLSHHQPSKPGSNRVAVQCQPSKSETASRK